MSLDLELKTIGRVEITALEETSRSLMDLESEIGIYGAYSDGARCCDVAVLALVWAIGELQKELTACLNTPGGSGRCFIGD